ncbi:MAG: hypothetical protein SAMD01599839_03940 [Rectinema sp.]
MKRKSEEILSFLIDMISRWPGVDCICVDRRSQQDELDPHYALVFDVYYRRSVPAMDKRQDLFDNPGAFESAPGGMKDRFFLDEIPIRVEYKHLPGVQDLVEHPLRHIKLLKNAGTYPLYRLLNFPLVFSRSDWIERMRAELNNFPQEAWRGLFDSFSAKMEHYLSDFGAAAVSENQFFRLMSRAGFLRFAGASVFMFNHVFEPSHAEYESQLKTQPVLPANFASLWDSIAGERNDLSEFKKFELARLLAREIFELQ